MSVHDTPRDRARGALVGSATNDVAVSASSKALLEAAVKAVGRPWALVFVDKDLPALLQAPGCLAGCRRLAATLGSTIMQALVVRAPGLEWAQRMAEDSALPVVHVDNAASSGAAVVLDIGSIQVVNAEPREMLDALENTLGTTLQLAEPTCETLPREQVRGEGVGPLT
ncbi:hypothetical protein JYT28_00700, partial [Desulfobulbus sp. AH-315-M07]|nr:hypothetical protein [Desulfobulbus sp. AH-315-M07]